MAFGWPNCISTRTKFAIVQSPLKGEKMLTGPLCMFLGNMLLARFVVRQC